MDKKDIINSRELFFKDIIEALFIPPRSIDIELEQHHYYITPASENVIFDAEMGDFLIHIYPTFFNKQYHIAYSIWQIGNKLKIAVIFYDRILELSPQQDGQNEFHNFWDGKPPKHFIRGDKMFYEWDFDVDDFYNNALLQERYTLGVRHMHFRVMRIVYDACETIYNPNL